MYILLREEIKRCYFFFMYVDLYSAITIGQTVRWLELITEYLLIIFGYYFEFNLIVLGHYDNIFRLHNQTSFWILLKQISNGKTPIHKKICVLHNFILVFKDTNWLELPLKTLENPLLWTVFFNLLLISNILQFPEIYSFYKKFIETKVVDFWKIWHNEFKKKSPNWPWRS